MITETLTYDFDLETRQKMIQTYEAIYESGVIRLNDNIRLPENTKVYVMVPEGSEKLSYRIISPRLARPGQSADFVKEVVNADEELNVVSLHIVCGMVYN